VSDDSQEASGGLSRADGVARFGVRLHLSRAHAAAAERDDCPAGATESHGAGGAVVYCLSVCPHPQPLSQGVGEGSRALTCLGC